MRSSFFCLLFACLIARENAQRNCTKDDYMFEYTACRADGSRWRVSVPKQVGACSGGVNPPLPGKGKPCDFTCASGEYLQTQGDEECHKCPPGTYSLGGNIRFDTWDKLPKDFTIQTENKAYEDGLYGSQHSQEVNCTRSRWYLHGDYVAAPVGSCLSNLVLSVKLIRDGQLTFLYDYPGYYSASLRVRIRNNRCKLSPYGTDRTGTTKYLLSTDSGSWRQESLPLSAGQNTIVWEVQNSGFYWSQDGDSRIAAKIKSIAVTGIAYASTCTSCAPGFYSRSGASRCERCPADFYAPQKGMSDCLPCNTTSHFSYSGATECIERSTCQEKDYFVTHTPCDKDGQTQLMYKWVEPKLCRDDTPTAVKLPPSGIPEKCPPCNPGMSSVNETDRQCMYCPKGQYSNGSVTCMECPPATEPAYNIEVKFWPNKERLPDSVTLYCVTEYQTSGCISEGWEFLSSFIGTNPHNSPIAFAKLTVRTAGFRGSESVVKDVAGVVGQVKFVFELECENKCQFTFNAMSGHEQSVEVETWTGSQPKQEYSYAIKSTDSARFFWTFQKTGKEDQKFMMGEYGHFHGTSDVKDSTSRVKIYLINVTNTVDGGASYCKRCLIESDSSDQRASQCQGCPEGHYISPTDRKCYPCPLNTRLNENHPIGSESCIPCGPGTISKPGSINCYSDCTFRDDLGRQYNFTRLGNAVHNLTRSSLFTSTGQKYSHFFSLDLCGEQKRARCYHDVLSLLDHRQKTVSVVHSHVCRATLMDRPGGLVFSIEPASLGDQLLAVVNSEAGGNLSTPSFIGDLATHNETVLNFFFKGAGATAACPEGRTAVVALHCDVTKKGQGELTFPSKCPDGTCDGCSHGFVWHTEVACPLCTVNDYEEVEEKCKGNKSRIIYSWNEPHHCFGGVSLPPNKQVTCQKQPNVVIREVTVSATLFDYKGYIGIALGIAVLLVVFLIVLYRKNRKLEYKYQQLKQSAKEGDELPAPETCVQESGDEDEVVYEQGIKPGQMLLKKLKGMAGKRKGDEMDEMEFQTVKLGPSSSTV